MLSSPPDIFGIPEILQQVISELPPLDIIRCQRVNSTWQKFINDSPLLQYKAWLRDDYPDATQHVRPDDLIPEYDRWAAWHDRWAAEHADISEDDELGDEKPGSEDIEIPDLFEEDPETGIDLGNKDVEMEDAEEGEDTDSYTTEFDKERIYESKRLVYNISKHFHPIVVARFMEDVPSPSSHHYDPLQDMKQWGFGGSLHFRPVLIRALMRWYEIHKSSETKWGHMSLCRPPSRRISLETPCSDDAGIPFTLEARLDEERHGIRYDSDYRHHDYVAYKNPGEPLMLTLSDLMANLSQMWDEWIDSEHEIHYLSHDGSGCDYDKGIPGTGCLNSDAEDEDDDDDEGEEWERETFGFKMSMEEHIDQAVMEASE